MEPFWAIQIVELASTREEAEQMLDWQAHQVGHLGGRYYQNHDGVWTMQAFQASEGMEHWEKSTFALPDGMKLVLIPSGQRKTLGLPV